MNIDLEDTKQPLSLRLTWRALEKYLDKDWRAQHPMDGVTLEEIEWSLGDIENYTMTPIFRSPIDPILNPEPNSFNLWRTVVFYACGHDIVTASLQGTDIPGRRHTWHYQYGLICPQKSLWKPEILWLFLPWDKIYI